MSQLLTLINVLEPVEISKLKKVRLIGKELAIFKLFYAHKQQELPELNEILNTIGVTSTHYYKICSILIDKFYEALVPTKKLDLLNFLINKGLYSHFSHEYLMQEKEFVKSSASIPSSVFYKTAFSLSLKVSATDLNEDFIQSIGNKYLVSLQGSITDEQYYVQSRSLNAVLFLLKATKKDIERSSEILAELQRIQALLVNSPNVLAKYHTNLAIASYYTHCESQPETLLSFLNKNLAIITENKALFSSNDLSKCEFAIAESLYQNSEFKNAFDRYKILFNKYEGQEQQAYYHVAKYAQLAIIIGLFDEAKNIIDRYFEIHVSGKNTSLSTMGCILYAKLYLNSDPSKANVYIQAAKKSVQKSYLAQYELEIRILESIYFMLKNEISVSKMLVKKNLKFMNSKGFTLKNSEMIYTFVILQSIIKNSAKNKGLTSRIKNKIHLLTRSYAAIYGILIEKVRINLYGNVEKRS